MASDDMENVKYEEEFISNSRGKKLFTCKWLPKNNKPPKALIFICHGYGMECRRHHEQQCNQTSPSRLCVYGIDSKAMENRQALRAMSRVLMMLLTTAPTTSQTYVRAKRTRKNEGYSNLENHPYNDIIDVAFKVPERLQEVTLPFIVLHGEDDRVTDTSVSKQLYEVASSYDKTLKLYPNMWHGLLYGEPNENTEIVFSDIINWLDKRSASGKFKVGGRVENG
ncbi:hypothetical protein M0R45_003459 [Rubus argutus]|uniref:Serine aminopeptidase S33 domain-containing protein n=1 Tax=Rubus argutus TaxID=59490 RepID=A0AAW1YFJ5_RUBAR